MEQKTKSPEFQELFCRLSLADGLLPKLLHRLPALSFSRNPVVAFAEIEALDVNRPVQAK
jgi:hypothetical protein